ncbi:MAG: pyridoxal phosphate-dependent aminotransferase [Planctomycetota bacterium]
MSTSGVAAASASGTFEVSERVRRLKPSATLAVSQKAAELRAQGVAVLSFAAGEPDFDTPAAIKAAVSVDLEAGKTKYAPVPGPPEVRELIAAKLRDENGIDTTAEHVVVTAGGKQALYELFLAIFDEGAGEPGELVVPEPAWVSYRPQAELAGGRVVSVGTDASSDFKATAEQIEAAITPRTRAVVLNSPSNPCGTMYSEAELRAIGTMLARHPQVLVISDEIYEKLIFGSVPHFSIGSMPEIGERVVTVNGLSKAYAMTGWRVGYLAGSGGIGLEIAKAVKKLQSQSTTSVPGFFASAIRVAMTESAGEVERMRVAFAARARLMHDRLSAMPGVVCAEPTGAMYCFPDVSTHFGKKSPAGHEVTSGLSFASALLEEQHVACVPGDPFGAGGEKCCRFSFACSEAQITDGMDKLETFLASLT